MPSHPTAGPAFSLPPLALLAGAGAAVVGALAWAGITYATEYEIGWAAWGIGILTGAAMAKLGGRGLAVAALAAALTIVSIAVGKLAATDLLLDRELAALEEGTFTRAFYDELRTDAADWADFAPAEETDVRRFMVDHAYTEAADPRDVTREELAGFRAESLPMLERLAAERPTYEEWRRDSAEEARAAFAAELSVAELVIENLTPIDAVFAVLAVTTAFGVVIRAGAGAAGATSSITVEDAGSRRRAA